MPIKSRRTRNPSERKVNAPLSDSIWLAVKRIEKATAAMPKLIEDLSTEVAKLCDQVKAADKVIIKLIADRDKPYVDYDTLRQHNHNYDTKGLE